MTPVSKIKVNPRRRPATAADVARAKQAATTEATQAVATIFLSVLRDKKDMSTEELQDIWTAVEERCDSLGKGYCNLSDLRDTLAQEDGIYIR